MVRKPVAQVKTATASAEYQCAKIVIRKTKIASRLNEHLTLVFFFFFFLCKMDHSMIFLLKFLLWARE